MSTAPHDQPESVAVLLARLDGRLETLTQTFELRMQQAEQRAVKAESKAMSAHNRINEEVTEKLRPLHEGLEQLRLWRAKLAGVGVGIGLVAGSAGGVVVWMLDRAANGVP